MRTKALRRTVAVPLMLFVLLAHHPSNGMTLVEAEIWEADYVIQTNVTYSSKGTNVWNLTEEDREISLFMNNTWQTVYLKESSCPIKRMEPDVDGNPVAVLELPKSRLTPGDSVNYTLTYSVQSKPRSLPHLDEQEPGNFTRIPSNLIDEYCIESDIWQINDPTLNQTAHIIAANETNVLSIVKEFVAWIWDNIDYPPQEKPKISHEVPLYPNQTILYGEGDCDDQAILFITLCRICGIPSFLQVGGIYEYGSTKQQSSWNGTVTSVLKQIAWHGWAMAYVPPWGWLPVDLTYTKGGKDDALNAIRAGAVTLQRTIQYMNISQRDYISSARRYRDFLMENQFFVYQKDEMKQVPRKFWGQPMEIWIRWFLVAGVIIAGTITAVFVYILKVRRQRSKESNQRAEAVGAP